MPDTLTQLLKYLQDGGTVPFEWMVEHAPDGTIEVAWNECNDPRTLLQLYARTGDRSGLVRAASACARTVLGCVSEDARIRIAVQTAEAWNRGGTSIDAVTKARDAAVDAAEIYGERADSAGGAVDAMAAAAAAAAAYASAAVADVAAAANDTAAATAAADAADAAADAAAYEVAHVDALAKLAERIRETVACPRLEELM